MKIGCFVGNYYDEKPGGAEIQMKYLVESFMEKGHEVAFFCYGDNNDKINISDKLTLHHIRKPIMGIKPLMSLKKKYIQHLLDKECLDVIYQRGDYHFSDVISKYGKKRGIPVVSGLSMERHCQKDFKSGLQFPQSLIEYLMKKSFYRNSTVIISQTKHQMMELKKNFGMESIIIPNGHPLPEDGEDKKENLVVWVANIKPIKQPEIYLDIARKCNHLDLKFKMLGRMQDESYKEMIGRFDKENENFEYMGQLMQDDVNKVIARSILLINTSESEGFSNTFIQAWMRSTPVLSFNSDPEGYISKMNIGHIPEGLEGSVGFIECMVEEPEIGSKMGRIAREFAKKEFDIQKISEKYLCIFEDQQE